MKEQYTKPEMLKLKKDLRKKILKGTSSHDLFDFLENELGYTHKSAEQLLWQIHKEVKEYYNKNKENFQSQFLEKYNYLYSQSVLEKNYANAKSVLDSMVKLTGASEATKQEISFDPAKPITIQFGFTSDTDDETDDENQ